MYVSRHIIPGRRAGLIGQIINSVKHVECTCPSPDNTDIIKNSNSDVIPVYTQVSRTVSNIRYGFGGTTRFGNGPISRIAFLGKLEGQPGGIVGPLRNKF